VFVTMPTFEQWMQLQLVRPLNKRLRAVTLSLDTPRFLFAYDVEREGHKLTQTTAIACESTLVDVVTSVPNSSRREICRVVKDRDGAPPYWRTRNLDVLWLSAKSEQASAGAVLFQLQGENCVRNVQMHEVAPAEGRVVLFKSPQARWGALRA